MVCLILSLRGKLMICAIFLRPPENSDVNSVDTGTIETDNLSGQVVFPLETGG
jgi:hypothetical protein